MDGPGRGGDLRLARAGRPRDPGPGGRTRLQPRSDHRRHPRRAARPALRAGRRSPAAGSIAPGTGFAEAIRAATGLGAATKPLSQSEALILMCIAYFQPITRGELGRVFGKEISRDVIGHLRALGFIAAGPRSPTPGAPYTYVTTKAFLSHFGFDTLRDLPDIETARRRRAAQQGQTAGGRLSRRPRRRPAVDGDDEPFERDEPLAG